MQVMLMRLMSKGEYLIVPKGTKFTEAGKLELKHFLTNIVMDLVGSYLDRTPSCLLCTQAM